MYLRALAACALVFFAHTCRSQASLAAENIIDDVKVNVGSTVEVFTLFRDARNEAQWYYVPNRPRLLEVPVGNQAEPQLSLVRYQFQDPADQAKLVEEGILQFAATLSAPGVALDEFRKQIKQRTGNDQVRISAIPFKSADVSLYTYPGAEGKSRLVANNPGGTGLAPLFASQSLAFSMPLTRMGTDVLDTLVKGNTGLPLAVTFSFNALTPPAGFKVTVDYSQLFTHYSKDEKFRAQASYFGWFGASYERTVQQIREELINNKDIKVEVISGEQFSLADIDKYLQPILARINAELIEAAKPPAEIAPATASTPSAGGWFGGGGYSVAIKDVTKVKKGTEVWDMRVQQIVERKTVAQGFIGLGAYPQQIKDRAVTTVPRSGFKSAYLMLPLPAVVDELGVSNIDLQVSLIAGGQPVQSQAVLWTPGGKWKDIGGGDRSVLAFPLTGLSVNDSDLKTAKFRSKINITTKKQVYTVETTSDAFDGQRAMPGVNGSLFDVVEVDGSGLSFAGLSNQGNILAANVQVKAGPQVLGTDMLRPKSINGTLQLPDPVRYLVPPLRDSTTPVIVNASFQTKGGVKKWRFDGSNIREQFGGTSIILVDQDVAP